MIVHKTQTFDKIPVESFLRTNISMTLYETNNRKKLSSINLLNNQFRNMVYCLISIISVIIEHPIPIELLVYVLNLDKGILRKINIETAK